LSSGAQPGNAEKTSGTAVCRRDRPGDPPGALPAGRAGDHGGQVNGAPRANQAAIVRNDVNDAAAHAAGGKPFTLTVIRPS
jgi:hypothetical protein